MSLVALPAELLLDLPDFLHSLEDLCSVFSTCRTLFRTCANPNPKFIPRLAANSGRVFFRPHPHLLIAATARQVADWAVQDDERRFALETAIQGGVDKLLELAINVSELTMDDIRQLYTYKCDVLNPVNRRLDLVAGPATLSPMTACNDPETTLLSWVIYGELFHHSLELAYLPLPHYKPLSSVIRYKWFVYCMPDRNSFKYLEFVSNEIPQFFKNYVQEDDDRVQQLSMSEAQDQFLNPSSWRDVLHSTPSFQAVHADAQEVFLSCVMHMGMKSLEMLVVGGPEKLKDDLDRIANRLCGEVFQNEKRDGQDWDEYVHSNDERLLKFVGDRWLHTAYTSLGSDLQFTLWSSWPREDDATPLMEAIRSSPLKITGQ
ncbi:hypothetical protein C8F04DRAFT_1250500 [Mycena alexandri]|uniref:F-box domain-containing protein n=1 Tax=Mycena alexandri TaxID=1745969 RepID=A0AAD6TCI1_9AGAR|nr:hypothetical protein C8F04DRAFT_1250500 [Mycena alexandri]